MLVAALMASAAFAEAGIPASAPCIDPIAYIRGELAAGRSAIKVPKARYRLVPGDGETCYLELRGLSDVAIDFSGSELVGAVRTRMFSLQSCTNVTLRNVSIDYETLPFTQGRIENL